MEADCWSCDAEEWEPTWSGDDPFWGWVSESYPSDDRQNLNVWGCRLLYRDSAPYRDHMARVRSHQTSYGPRHVHCVHLRCSRCFFMFLALCHCRVLQLLPCCSHAAPVLHWKGWLHNGKSVFLIPSTSCLIQMKYSYNLFCVYLRVTSTQSTFTVCPWSTLVVWHSSAKTGSIVGLCCCAYFPWTLFNINHFIDFMLWVFCQFQHWQNISNGQKWMQSFFLLNCQLHSLLNCGG